MAAAAAAAQVALADEKEARRHLERTHHTEQAAMEAEREAWRHEREHLQSERTQLQLERRELLVSARAFPPATSESEFGGDGRAVQVDPRMTPG